MGINFLLGGFMSKPWAVVNHFREIEGIHAASGMLLGLGILMTLLGFGAICYSVLATIASVSLLGFFLLSSGVAYLIHTFWVKQWKGVFVSLLLATFLVVLGILCIVSPLEVSMALTLLIGAFFFVSGIMRIVSAIIIRFESWGWYALNGVVALILGMLILSGWPASGLWIIGLFVGIDILFAGLSWIFLAHTLIRS
jgi:uncharacterized membrane protein HdeD (DUF308 family)